MANSNLHLKRDTCIPVSFRKKHVFPLLDIMGILKSKLTVKAVYLLRVRHTHESTKNFLFPENHFCSKYYCIDLMVICTKIPSNAIADLNNTIKEFTNGTYNVNLLLHKPAEIKQSKTSHSYFFNQVGHKGWWLGGTLKLHSLMSSDTSIVRDPIRIQQFCEQRCRAAKYLQHMEYELEDDTVSLLKINLLHQSIVQLCLGLIYKYMNYHPNYFNLIYLLNLCHGFTTLAEKIFPQHSQQDKEIFHILNTPLHNVRHKKLDCYKLYHVQLLEDRCREFYDRSSHLIQPLLT